MPQIQGRAFGAFELIRSLHHGYRMAELRLARLFEWLAEYLF